MATEDRRVKLKKITDAFFNKGKSSLRLYESGIERKFIEYLKLNKTNYNIKPKFELRGYPVHNPNTPPYGSEIHKNRLIDRFLNKRNRIMQGSMTIAISYKCSYICEQCYITEYRDSSKKEMTVDEFKIVFNKIVNEAAVWHFDITGGEPLEHPDFFEIIKQIPPDRATTIVATNGLLIDEKMASKIKHSNIMICKVSLDLYSGLDSYAMKKALKSIKIMADNKVYAFAQIYLKRGFTEYFDLRVIIEKCRKAGSAFVHFISPMAIGNLKKHDELFFTDEERKNIYFWQAYYELKYGYKILLFPDWEIIGSGCRAARGRVYIDPYGDIHPCNFIPKPYGNILTDDLKQVILNMQNDIGNIPDNCYSANCSLSALNNIQCLNLSRKRKPILSTT